MAVFQYDFDLHPTYTYFAMEKLVEEGLVRSLGVSNFNSGQITDILERCMIRPAVNQVECHPFFNQGRLVEFCKERGVAVAAFSPLGSPARPWAQEDAENLLENHKLKWMAEQHDKSVAQVQGDP